MASPSPSKILGLLPFTYAVTILPVSPHRRPSLLLEARAHLEDPPLAYTVISNCHHIDTTAKFNALRSGLFWIRCRAQLSYYQQPRIPTSSGSQQLEPATSDHASHIPLQTIPSPGRTSFRTQTSTNNHRAFNYNMSLSTGCRALQAMSPERTTGEVLIRPIFPDHAALYQRGSRSITARSHTQSNSRTAPCRQPGFCERCFT